MFATTSGSGGPAGTSVDGAALAGGGSGVRPDPPNADSDATTVTTQATARSSARRRRRRSRACWRRRAARRARREATGGDIRGTVADASGPFNRAVCDSAARLRCSGSSQSS